MRRLVLETRCGLYVGQRTAETRAEAPVMRSAAQRRCAICRRELWTATLTGTMCGSESRGRQVESCYHKLRCEGGIKCVLAAVWGGGLARTQTRRERCYSRAGEGRNWVKRKRKGWLESWRWGRICVNVPHKPRASTALTPELPGDSAAQAKDKEGKGQHRRGSKNSDFFLKSDLNSSGLAVSDSSLGRSIELNTAKMFLLT